MPIPLEFIPVLREISEQLVLGHYSQLVADGRTGREVTAARLAEAIDHYGRTLVTLPPEAYVRGEIFPFRDKIDTWAIDLPIWTAEEGESDLTLQLIVVREGHGYSAVIRDLHVL